MMGYKSIVEIAGPRHQGYINDHVAVKRIEVEGPTQPGETDLFDICIKYGFKSDPIEPVQKTCPKRISCV